MMFITTSHSQPAHHPEIGHSNLLLTWSSHAMLSKAQAEVKKQPWTQLWCCYSYSTWRTWTWWFSTSLYCSSEFVSSWILAYCKPHRGTSRWRMTTEKTQSEVTKHRVKSRNWLVLLWWHSSQPIILSLGMVVYCCAKTSQTEQTYTIITDLGTQHMVGHG